jgi:hypothetical protein
MVTRFDYNDCPRPEGSFEFLTSAGPLSVNVVTSVIQDYTGGTYTLGYAIYSGFTKTIYLTDPGCSATISTGNGSFNMNSNLMSVQLSWDSTDSIYVSYENVSIL